MVDGFIVAIWRNTLRAFSKKHETNDWNFYVKSEGNYDIFFFLYIFN